MDSIETEKSRIVLQELENGWWILSSIQLTRLPASEKHTQADREQQPTHEYSAREVSPPQLLLKQLQRANRLFLLHHAASLQELYTRVGRSLFCSLLERYWTRFATEWDVLLHGNPAVEIYDGIKLASGGELGVGVGEEEWGSGEREVLEDFVRRTDGCVDLVVSRFGNEPARVNDHLSKTTTGQQLDQPAVQPWLGLDIEAESHDGVVFSGVRALTKPSLRTVSRWIEAIFKHGEEAYGVGENPTSRPRRRKDRTPQRATRQEAERTEPKSRSQPRQPSDLRRRAMQNSAFPPGIPPPLVTTIDDSRGSAVKKADKKASADPKKPSGIEPQDPNASSGTETMMKYLTLGYGTAWTFIPKLPANVAKSGTEDVSAQSKSESNVETSAPVADQVEDEPADLPLQHVDPTPEVSEEEEEEETPFVQRLEQSIGKFIVGLTGDLENTEFDASAEEDGAEADHNGDRSNEPTEKTQRIFVRTLNVLVNPEHGPHIGSDFTSSMTSAIPANNPPPTSAGSSVEGVSTTLLVHRKLRVVVYIHQPFIFLFLFDLQTPLLSMPNFYRNLHHQLGPLQRPLLASTNPDPMRIADRVGFDQNDVTSSLDIHEIVVDPINLTLRTTIPNIPLPGSLAAEGLVDPTIATGTGSLGSPPRTITVSGSWYTLGIPISSSISEDTGAVSTATGVQRTKSGTENHRMTKQWTRIEALSVQSQILTTYIATRPSTSTFYPSLNADTTGRINTDSHSPGRGGKSERTVRTARGWWVTWLKLPSAQSNGPSGTDRDDAGPISSSDVAREAIFVRRANDNTGTTGRNWYGRASGDSNEAAGANRTVSGGGKWMLRRDRLRDVSGSTVGIESGGAGGGLGIGVSDEDDGTMRRAGAGAGGGAMDLRKYADALGALL